MLSNVRFVGFINEELRDKVNVAGKDAIYLDCDCNASIFKLLMTLGAEVRFADTKSLDYVLSHIGLINVNKVYTDSNGESHFELITNDTVVTNTTIIADYDRNAITGISGNSNTLVEFLNSRIVQPRSWVMYLENVPVIFGTLSMGEAILTRAGVFGMTPKESTVKPKHYKYDTQIKVPDGKTPWSDLPTARFYIDGNGHRHMLDDKKEE